MKSNLKPFDSTLFITVLILTGLGIIMVLSASSHLGEISYGSPYFFFKRQIIWVIAGIAVMLFLSRLDYKVYKNLYVLIFVVALIFLALVLVPGIGSGEIRGAKRWINLGFMDFQPSELAKLATIIFLSASLSKNYKSLSKFWSGLVPYFIIVGLVCGLLFLEPHYSSMVIIFAISCILLFTAGAKIWHFLVCLIPVGILGGILIAIEPYRVSRIFGYLKPFEAATGSGWQIIQSLYAIGTGGIFGLGLGQSKQKYLYLPDAHNDFILSIWAEEMGLIGMILIVALFAIFIWRGIRIATKAPDLFGGLLATGITMLVAIQVILNIGIITNCLPVTGMPVPFLSYGGTSMLFFMAEVGILLNISRKIETL